MTKKATIYKFPKNFLWGSATSGPQTEGMNGGRSESVFDHFYKTQGNRFFEGRNCEGDLYHRYPEYVAQAKKLNFNSLRTSIQWTRLIPDGKTVNQDAVKFYRDYFLALKNSKIEPYVCLFHFDMPMWMQNQGGFTNRDFITKYAEYAEVAFTTFGDIVTNWFTFCEPCVPVEGGYLYDFHYPNKVNIKEAMQAQFNTVLAHVKVVKLFKDNKYPGRIGTILNILPAIPRSQNPHDVQAARWADLFQNECFIDPWLLGTYPQELINEAKKRNFLWEYTQADLDFIKSAPKIDILGVNFYNPQRVKAVPYVPNWESAITPRDFYFTDYDMPGKRMNVWRGWEIYPKALYLTLKKIQERYGNIPTFISENGMGVANEEQFREKGTIIDTYRIDFFTEHLQWIHKAIKEGANCTGFHMWTYIDNWSWTNAYKNRYGFVEFDLKTKEFKEKLSANWIRDVIKTNSVKGFE